MIELLLGLTVLIVVGYGVIIVQMITLARLFRSRAWVLLAGGFVVTGARIGWGFIRLPARLIRNVERIPDALSIEQWILIVAAFVAIVLFILGLNVLRRNLRAIGI